MTKLLILDGAGVLVHDRTFELFATIAGEYGIEESAMNDFLVNVYNPWWRGEWDHQTFWQAFDEHHQTESDSQARHDEWGQTTQPFDHVQHLPKMSLHADLWLASDHDFEWITAALGDHFELFHTTIISRRDGVCKKDEDYFHRLHERSKTYDQRLFVDDRQENLDKAKEAGIDGLLADEKGEWVSTVFAWLEAS